MYDPDNPNPKPPKIIVNQSLLPHQQERKLLSEKELLKFYLINSQIVRERYGLERVEGKLRVKDRAVIDSLPVETRTLLREVYLELNERG